jgi:hypothetical protein
MTPDEMQCYKKELHLHPKINANSHEEDSTLYTLATLACSQELNSDMTLKK